ncbi:hypothetical protein TARUN_7076 [Trichoderma arundinaceum]|uniref:C2H2-type domain-containing protein n=1 Tax=Trichoderma arundinaceum TaxID=490622 RepID=A0A395NGD3_TRIAR|nr:hypothetical protein TARUN_7076 [Trichoderma arundinaceum]
MDTGRGLMRTCCQNDYLFLYMARDFSYPQSSMASTAPAMFSFSHTEPSTDLLNGSSWGANAEGPQNLHDYPDNGSSHSGEAEEYLFTSGHNSPRGPRLDQAQPSDVAWSAPKAAMSIASGAQAMSRASSSRSNGSAVSPTQMSNMSIVRGNAQAFRNGPQSTGSMAGMDSCLLLDSDAHGVSPHMYWPDYALEMNLGADGVPFPVPNVNPLHVVPSQMHLANDAVPDTSSPSTWDCFSSSISRTSSPATIDDAWQPAPFSPDSSPELCRSPRYVIFHAEDELSSYRLDSFRDRKIPMMPEDMHKHAVSQIEDASILPQAYTARRQGSEGESARDHALYKNVTPQGDGLFHCPWEGQPNCNHKPEKLKCNYDKFVDSHLKPYRCKAEACEGARFSSTACLLRHEREAHGLHGHGDKPFLCMYEDCERSILGSGFPRQWNLRDHMKRVHNDHGSTGASPTTAAQQAAKGRKRKSDASETQGSTSRKASIKSMPAPEPKQPPVKPLIEQWLDHRKAVEDLVRRMNKPEDVQSLQHISEAQKRLEAMLKMATDLASTTPKTEMPAGRRHYMTG